VSGKRERLPIIATLLAAALGLAACSSPSGANNSAGSTFVRGSESPSDAASATESATPTPKPSPPSAKPKPTATAKPKPGPSTSSSSTSMTSGKSDSLKRVFPVVGNVSYAHTHHDYPATDIIAACGNTVRAPISGVILQVTLVDTWKASVNAGATRGGLSFSIKGNDGIRYYGSHLEAINSAIRAGVHVAAGQTIGKVGRTGDAGACHLHFGLSPVCRGTGDWWIQRGVVYPWPYLDSWRQGGNKSPVDAVNAWQKQHGCPSKPLVDP
jgi:murein DD-endopeptidase MepM/ murein hydrolase activator NlpD